MGRVIAVIGAVALCTAIACRDRQAAKGSAPHAADDRHPVRALGDLPTADQTSPATPWLYLTVDSGILRVAKTLEGLGEPGSAVDSANLVDRMIDLAGEKPPEVYPRGMAPLWSRTHRGDHRYERRDFAHHESVLRAQSALWDKRPLLLLERQTPGVDLVWIAQALDQFSARIVVGAAEAVHPVAIGNREPSRGALRITTPVLVLTGGHFTVIGHDGLTVTLEPNDGRPDYASVAKILTFAGFGAFTTEPPAPAAQSDEPPLVRVPVSQLTLVNRDTIADMMPILDMAARYHLAQVDVAYAPPAIRLHKMDSVSQLEQEIRTRQTWPIELTLDRVFGPSGPIALPRLQAVMNQAIAQAKRDYRRQSALAPTKWSTYYTVTVDPDGTVASIKPYGDERHEFAWLEKAVRAQRFPRADQPTRFEIHLSGNACWPGSFPSRGPGPATCQP